MSDRRMRVSGGAGRLLALLALLVATSACTAKESSAPEPEKPDLGTPLAKFHTHRLVVARAPFCDQVPDDAVARALDGPARRETAYASGQRARLTADVRDVAHENGCSFRGRKKAVARAWVFAPPVTRARARDLVAAGARTRGCVAVPDAPDFGRPSAAITCEEEGVRVTTYAGLFGDTWLSCSLSSTALDADTLLDRTGRWCVEVAQAAATG